MLKITLAQAINLLSQLHKKANDLHHEFYSISVIQVPKGEEYTPYERTVDEVLNEIMDLQVDILQLKEIIQTANLNNRLEWDGSLISLSTAIEKAKQLRGLQDLYRSLAMKKKREYQIHHRSSAILEEIALFEPADFKKKFDKISRQTELLSSKIDKVNYTVEIDVPFANKYLLE